MGPITGPFNRVKDEGNGHYEEANWYRQARPYNLPLNYDAFKCDASVKGVTDNGPWIPSSTDAWGYTAGLKDNGNTQMMRIQNQAYARAYDSWQRKAKASASLAVTLAESKQAYSMIAMRTRQLLSAARALNRYDLNGFQKALNIKRGYVRREEGRRAQARDLSGTWLEYTFGWVPLISDIGNAVEVLQQQFDPIPIRGRGVGQAEVKTRLSVNEIKTASLLSKVEVRGTIVVTNPNLFLANQLGFTNPAMVAWELVPFSFVVDWFIPVGKFISSWTDSIGSNIVNPSVTYKRSASSMHDMQYFGANHEYSKTISSFGKKVIRQTGGFSIPTLRSRSRIPTADLWYAGTSLSLLVQQLKSFKK